MTDRPQLKLYNSLTRHKEDFVPRDPKRVTMYNCGPTVYSYAHIGNARAAVVADVLFRVLRHIYGEDHVVYARNITDVDDKIIAAANEAGVPISDITEKYARIYNEDLAALGCLPPTHQPKATDAIGEMQDIIVELLKKDIAYISGDQVLFDVSKDKGYGRLVDKMRLEGDQSGIRVAVADYKRNPADFALWKYVDDEDDKHSFDAPKIQAFADENWRKFFNEPKQLSPGRPGWHIECSAMIREVLGETIDIHCGGIDLKFPHHENEMAQSQCANGKPLANYWVHNEFLQMGSEKMSKSLGNVKLIHDLLKDWDGEVIRLALLKAHYRSELVWSEDLLKESKANLDEAYRELQKSGGLESKLGDARINYYEWKRFIDDLNIRSIWDHLSSQVGQYRAFNTQDNEFGPDADEGTIKRFKSYEKGKRIAALDQITLVANLLGLLQKDPDEWFGKGVTDAHRQLAKDYDAIRAQALEAKAAGDKAEMGRLFSEADKLRDQLTADGVVIETKNGVSTLRRA